MRTMELRLGLDAHCHFRQGVIARAVLPETAKQFGAGIAEPNLSPLPILTGEDAVAYKAELGAIIAKQYPAFRVFPLIQVIPNTKPHMIREAKKHGVLGVKLYPRFVTTNSENGIENYVPLYPVFEALQEQDMVATFHGEHPSRKVQGRDKAKRFIDEILIPIAKHFPNLRISLEHISVAEAVDFVLAYPDNVVATITPQHLLYTEDDVEGYSEESGGLGNPHLLCKPKLQTHIDRARIQAVVLSGSHKFFLGSDTAPHVKSKKEAAKICCGVYNAPILLPALADFFDRSKRLHLFEPFVAIHGFSFWKIKPSDGYVVLNEESWQVPDEYPVAGTNDGIVPMMAGKTLPWKVSDQKAC